MLRGECSATCSRAPSFGALGRPGSASDGPASAIVVAGLPLVKADLELEAESVSHPLQRGERRSGPTGLQSANYGLGCTHPLGQLTLAQPTRLA